MQTGQNVHDPLTQLNSHMGYGLMAGLNPFADMGINPNDPNMVCRYTLLPLYHRCLANAQIQSMMSSPEFLQQMSSLMSNPAILEQALAQNPQFASMAPQAREMFQSERFRQMMFASPTSAYLTLLIFKQVEPRDSTQYVTDGLDDAWCWP